MKARPPKPNAADVARRGRGPAPGVGALTAAAMVATFVGWLCWRDHQAFWNDDFALSILPVFTDVARALAHAEWPLLSPCSWVCGNLAGEYQYGTFSPFVNAAVAGVWAIPLPFPAQAAALSGIHLAALAAGSYLLAERRAYGPMRALTVGCTAALNGWIVCWGAADWFGALAAFAWLPWFWWALERALARPLTRARWLAVVACLYLVLTGGFPYTVLMVGLVTVAATARSLPDLRAAERWQALAGLAFAWICASLLASPALWALLTLVQGSARPDRVHGITTAWTVPWRALAGILLPSFATPWPDFAALPQRRAAIELAGAALPAALLVGALARGWRPRAPAARVDLLSAAVVLALCLLPTFGLFRWSFRFLPLFHLAFALAACSADAGSPDPPTRRFRPSNAAIAGACLVAFTMLGWACATLVSGVSFPRPDANAALAAAYAAVGAVWGLLGWTAPSLGRRLLPAVALALFAVTYAILPTDPGVPRFAIDDGLRAPAPLDPARLYLGLYREAYFHYTADRTGPGFGRVLRPGSTPMYAGLRFLNGYSPVGPAGIGTLLGAEIHGEFDPGKSRALLRDEAGPDGLLARLGVDGIVADPRLGIVPPETDWQGVFQNAEGTVYLRRGAPLGPVTWWQGANDGTVRRPLPGRLVAERRGRVVVDLDPAGVPAGGRLLFSRPWFPGYHAYLNGRRVPIEAYRGLTPAVPLGPGTRGRLELVYEPDFLRFGRWLSAAGVLLLLLLWLAPWVRGLRIRPASRW